MRELHYSMYIRWSEEDQCYIAWLPEFGDHCKTHGETYEEAARNGRDILEMMLDGEEHPPTPYVYGGGHTITPPANEAEPLDRDWYDKAMAELDRRVNQASAERAAG